MPNAFRHEALFYAGAEEFLAGIVLFLREGLEKDEPAMVAVCREKAELIEAEMGADAAAIGFAPMEHLGANPARIIPFWHEFVECCGVERPVRGIGEPIWPGRSAAEIDECQRHESLLNQAFAEPDRRLQLLCPYDAASLPGAVVEAAHGPHGRCPEEPRNPFRGSLPPRPGGAKTLEFDRRTLHEVRGLVAGAAVLHGLSGARCSDLVTAASELAANSVVHGGGRGRLAVWAENGCLLIEVEDAGWIEDPMAGRIRPDPTQVSGRGLWLVNRLCDLVQIRSGPASTAVRIQLSVSASSSVSVDSSSSGSP